MTAELSVGKSVVDITVVIPALNAEATLAEQLQCLESQRDAPPFRVLISDNGSTDSTRDIVHQWIGRLDISVLDASDRRGAGHARNRGAQAATTAKILFCDADDLVSETWVHAMAEALEPSTIASGPVMRITPETPAWTPPDPSIPLSNSDAEYRYMNLLPCVLSGSMGIHRSDFLAIGGFDNSFGRGCEDVDFSWRAQLSGLRLKIAHDCVIYYRPRSTALETFRAERGYTRTSVLLWLRFRDQPGITGMSFRWSVQALLRTLLQVRLQTARSSTLRIHWAGRLGAYLGSVEGHLKYRVLGSAPPRELIGDIRPEESESPEFH